MNFVLPVCRSSFSLLYGTSSPEALLRAAAGYGYPGLVLADRNNLYGCYDFYYQALENNQKAIIGAELTTAIGEFSLICENHDGFKNLSRLITSYQLEGKPSVETISSYSRNLFCVTGRIPSLELLREIFGDRLYLSIGYDKPSQSYRLAGESGIKPVAFPAVTFLRREEYAVHRLLRAIDGGHLLDNLPEHTVAHPEEYLREPSFYNDFYASFPEAVKNNLAIAEACHLTFPRKRNILPDIIIDGDHFEKLRNDALSGMKQRLPHLSGQYFSRLEYELSVIQRTGFVDYFLIVGEIIGYCRSHDIPVVGRGSAAGSLVSYGLGITQVDPLREGLYFERFLNEARSDCPDIDLDIDWRRRDDVLDFIYKRYGAEHVAMMATYTHFQSRLAVRETAKALGFAPEEIDRFLKRLPHTSLEQLEKEAASLPSATKLKLDRERFRPALMAARSISGLPRHLGIHPGGIVITPEPLTDYIPLERATKGIVVTQCDMYQAEKIGLVKIDILGQRGLAVIADCHEAVKKIKGDNFKIPENDPDTYDILRKGKTIGVFQIESPGLRALLRDLQPRELNDITLALALIRPGASESGMKRIFLNRFHGKEKTSYPHENLEPVLKETFGVFIYQEQVILAAQKIAGFNLPASDLLRRAITKKRHQKEHAKLQSRFLEGARRMGIDRAVALSIFGQLAQFASFGFCKAHAATYGNLAYQSAYFKTHYPDIFMTAVLRNGGGYYPSSVYVAEARRLGIRVVPPDIDHSENIDSLQGGQIYLGIGRVREITGSALEQIKIGKPFASLGDFLSRAEISGQEMENLIKVGFFDSLETSRARLLWEYRLWGKGRTMGKDDLFKGRSPMPRMRTLPLSPCAPFDIFRAEREILELSASFHPLTLFNDYHEFDLQEVIDGRRNLSLILSGWLADRKRIKTKDGHSMVFLTFDSLHDTFEVILFPQAYDKYSETIRSYRYLTVEGKLSFDDGNPAIIAERITPAPTGLKEARHI